jgi:hypothetical protein
MKTNMLFNLMLISALLLVADSTKLRTKQIAPQQKYLFRNVATNQCVQYKGPFLFTATANCDMVPTNLWRIEKQPEGWYIIRSGTTLQVMDIENISLTDGSKMHTWDWWGGNNQKWFLDPVVGSNVFQVRSMNSGKCLTQNSGSFMQMTCNSGDLNQRYDIQGFKATPGAGDFAIVNKVSGYCVKFVNKYVGIGHGACEGASPSNLWNFEYQATGDAVLMRNKLVPQVIDVNGISMDDGALIQTWDWWAGGNQIWFVDFIDSTWFMLRASHSNKCITTNGTQFKQLTCSPSNNDQLFKVVQPQTYTINIQAGINYAIINKESGWCYKWVGAFTDNLHAACDLLFSNYWKFEKTDNWYIIRSIINNQVMDITGISQDAGAIVHNWDWWGGNNQKWYVEPVDNTWFMLRSVNSSKCVSAAGSGYTQQICNNADNKQLFRIEAQKPVPIVPNTDYGIVNKISGNCMRYTKNFDYQQHTTCDWSAQANYWRFELNTDWYIIRSTVTPQVIDVEGISLDNGGKIHTWDWWGGNNQKWTVEFVDPIYFMLRSVNSKKCITTAGGAYNQMPCSSTDGTQLFNVQARPPPGQQVSGKLISALTGLAIPSANLIGAKVTFISTTGQSISAAVDTTTATYTVILPGGTYSGKAESANYVPANVNLNVAQAAIAQDFVLNPVDQNTRFVLTWGVKPQDLDLYLFNTRTNDVGYFRNKNIENMRFDVDKTKGNGPETITLMKAATDVYKVQVRRYSTDGLISESQGKLEVYREGALVQTVNIPPTPVPSDWIAWDVLTYNASNGNVTILNAVKKTPL